MGQCVDMHNSSMLTHEIVLVADLQDHNHSGSPIRPAIANAPAGVLKPLAIMLCTQLRGKLWLDDCYSVLSDMTYI